MKRLHFLLCVVAVLAGSSRAMAVPVTISDVPAYEWYHGCGPTAAASVLGYWDLHGYPNLFTADGWASVSQTVNVQDQISSPEHNARYDPTPDNLSSPQSWNSIADWFRTSEDPLEYGWSYQSYAVDAFEGYANYRGYAFDAWDEPYSAFTFADLESEINAGLPMMFLVDSTGDGTTDHFVPVVGYDDRGSDGLWYGVYTTWTEAEDIAWFDYRGMSSDYSWGVAYVTEVLPLSAPIPEPTTAVLMGLALVGLAGKWRIRRIC